MFRKNIFVTCMVILASLTANLSYAENTAQEKAQQVQKQQATPTYSNTTYPPLKPKPPEKWTPWAFAAGFVATAIIGICVVSSDQGEKAYKNL